MEQPTIEMQSRDGVTVWVTPIEIYRAVVADIGLFGDYQLKVMKKAIDTCLDNLAKQAEQDRLDDLGKHFSRKER